MQQLNLNIENTDIYVYSGDINRFGYHAISQYLDGMEDKKKDLLLCLATVAIRMRPIVLDAAFSTTTRDGWQFMHPVIARVQVRYWLLPPII